MTWLSKTQTERILQDIRQQGVHSPDLAEDLLDHICSAVEREMAAGLDFEEAYEKIRSDAFAPGALGEVQAQTEALLAGTGAPYPNLVQSFGLLLGWCAGMAGIQLLAAPLLSDLAPGVFANDVSSQLMMLGVTVLLLGYARKKVLRGAVPATDPFALVRPVPRALYPVLTLLVLCGSCWTGALFEWLLPVPAHVQQGIQEGYRHGYYLSMALAMLLMNLLMELLFRGIILEGLLQRYAPFTAIFYSSLLYGLSTLNPWGFIACFTVGMLNGWLFYRTRSLAPALYVRVVMGGLHLVFLGVAIHSAGALSNLSLRGMVGNDPLYYVVVLGSVLTTAFLLGWLKRNLAALAFTH